MLLLFMCMDGAQARAKTDFERELLLNNNFLFRYIKNVHMNVATKMAYTELSLQPWHRAVQELQSDKALINKICDKAKSSQQMLRSKQLQVIRKRGHLQEAIRACEKLGPYSLVEIRDRSEALMVENAMREKGITEILANVVASDEREELYFRSDYKETYGLPFKRFCTHDEDDDNYPTISKNLLYNDELVTYRIVDDRITMCKNKKSTPESLAKSYDYFCQLRNSSSSQYSSVSVLLGICTDTEEKMENEIEKFRQILSALKDPEEAERQFLNTYTDLTIKDYTPNPKSVVSHSQGKAHDHHHKPKAKTEFKVYDKENVITYARSLVKRGVSAFLAGAFALVQFIIGLGLIKWEHDRSYREQLSEEMYQTQIISPKLEESLENDRITSFKYVGYSVMIY